MRPVIIFISPTSDEKILSLVQSIKQVIKPVQTVVIASPEKECERTAARITPALQGEQERLTVYFDPNGSLRKSATVRAMLIAAAAVNSRCVVFVLKPEDRLRAFQDAARNFALSSQVPRGMNPDVLMVHVPNQEARELV